MRLLICGSRHWSDYSTILLKMFAITFLVHSDDVVVIDGAARGADEMGHRAGVHMGFETLRFPADWVRYGRSAGPVRNRQMLISGAVDYVLAFPLRGSIGTWDMIRKARKRGVEVEVWGGLR